MLAITRRQTVMLGILISGTFVAILNQMILSPALPTIMVDMNVSASTVQWLTTGFTLMNAVMIPITAYLTDRFSVRSLFIVAMGIFTGGTLVAAWGPSFAVLLIARLVQAVGAGVLMPMVMTVMLLTFPVDKRGMAMGIFNIIIAFAPTIGPVIAGIIIDRASWNAMFLAVAVLAAIDVVCAVIFLEHRQPQDPSVKGVDKLSVLLSSFGFGGMLYGFSEVGNSGLSPTAVVAMACGFLVVCLFFRRQLRLEQPMLRVRVLKNRRFLIGTVIAMIVQAATMANGVLIPVYVQSLCGQSATMSALVMLPGGIMMGIMGPIAGNLFDKHGPRAICITGLSIVTVGTLFMTQLSFTTGMAFIAIVCFFRLLGLSMVNMPVTTWGMNALDNKVINHGNAVNNTLRQVAGSLGTALVISAYSLFSAACTDEVGALQAQMLGVNFAYAVQAVLLFIAFVIAVVFVRNRKSDAVREDPQGERKMVLETLMSRELISLPVTATVADAAHLFVEKRVDAVPLIDTQGEPVGFVSDGDLMRAFSPQREGQPMDPYALFSSGGKTDPDLDHWVLQVMGMPVRSIANDKVISVDIHTSLADVYHVLGENRLRRVPVLEDGRFVGMISRFAVTTSVLGSYLARSGGGELPQG